MITIYTVTYNAVQQQSYHSTMISSQLLIVSACIATVFSACPAGWMEFENHCYLFSAGKDTWVNARVMCKYHGSDLISIETPAEQAEFQKIALTYNHTIDDDGFWLSGTDWTQQGNWVWEATGKPITWFTWGVNTPADQQPNNREGSEDCMAAVKYYNYDWSDEFCDWDHHLQYVCERPANQPGVAVG